MEKDFATSRLVITTGDMRDRAEDYLKKTWNVDASKYPYISWFSDESSLKIATVRQIQEHVSFAHTDGTRYCVVLGIDTASLPAQNALLKLVEEPPAHTQIVLIGNSLASILPTIQSRCLIDVESEQVETVHAESVYTELYGASIPTALEQAENYTDRAEALTLTSSLLQYLHAELEKNGENQTLQQHLQATLALKKRLEQNCNVQLVVEEAFLQYRS